MISPTTCTKVEDAAELFLNKAPEFNTTCFSFITKGEIPQFEKVKYDLSPHAPMVK